MKNWEFIKKRIMELDEEEMINFLRNFGCQELQIIARSVISCKECGLTYDTDCKKQWLKREYQEPKNYIIHRTLRTQQKEVYIRQEPTMTTMRITTHYITQAKTYTLEKAIEIRDKLNINRVGRQYLWVISKVK